MSAACHQSGIRTRQDRRVTKRNRARVISYAFIVIIVVIVVIVVAMGMGTGNNATRRDKRRVKPCME